jgi:hypothetical protein
MDKIKYRTDIKFFVKRGLTPNENTRFLLPAVPCLFISGSYETIIIA